MKNIVIAIVITALLIGGYLGYRYYSENYRDGNRDDATQTLTEDPRPIAAEDPSSAESGGDSQASEDADATGPQQNPPLPPLSESDELVRETLGGLTATGDESNGPRNEAASLAREVLDRKDLIRKLVTAVDLMGRGKNPYKLFNFLSPDGSLEVEERDGKLYLSPKNYERYDAFVEAIATVEPGLLASGYHRLQPLFSEAFDELGNEGVTWSDRLEEVLEEWNEFDEAQGEIELLGREGVYIFADPRLESLDPVHKLLIRMGPEHTRTLRRKLAAIRQEMDTLGE